MQTQTEQIRTEIQPYGTAQFIDVDNRLSEIKEYGDIVFLKSDIKLIEQHRAAYGCNAYQIWEVTETGKKALERFYK